MLSKRRFLGRRRRVIEFIGTRSSDYCDFLVDPARPQVLPLMLRCLIENQRDWDLLHFSGIPDSSTTLRVLPKFFNQCGCLSHARQLYEAPTHLFGDSIADRQLVRKKSLRRHFNCLRRQGRLEFKNYTAPEEIAACLDVFFQQHIRRRALTDCPSEFLNERERTFCKEVAQALAPTRWLLFSAVLLNQKPIAFHFGFEYGNRIIWYKPTFDVDYSKHSPGEVLIKYLLEYAAERKVAEFDFGIGQEAFKYRFANHVRVTYAVRVFRRKMPYHLDRLLEDARALVKRRPTLLRLGHRLLYRWRIHRWS
jgi:CelD/BcsL family acetyltransferase involved in cellulose biosynthesis